MKFNKLIVKRDEVRMKREVALSVVVMGILLASVFWQSGMAAKPPKASLSVNTSEPVDGVVVETGGSFDVVGIVNAIKGDAGAVRVYVQFSYGEDTSNFENVDGNTLSIVNGQQPYSTALLNGESVSVSWTLTGQPGTYEIRVYAVADLAKSGSSNSVTVIIEAPPPPPGVFLISGENQDSSIGYGSSSGTYSNTFYDDGVYEILSEEKNAHGTKKPVDDSTELGWIFEFNLPTPRSTTTFYFYGYAEFPEGDSDTTFLVQEELGGSWSTILEISHISQNKILYSELSDLTSPSVSLRIVDDDQSIGNKILSSLYIDQAFIGGDDYEAPISGIEILTAPYTCHRFQAWENYGNNWYHDTDIPITSAAATDIGIVDLDFDGHNELVVAKTMSEIHGTGIVEIFDMDLGTSPVDTLVLPEPIVAAVMSIAVGNFDDDPDLEIAGAAAYGGAVIWDKVDGKYQVALMLLEDSVVDLVNAGNLDADDELEIVFANGFDPVLCEVMLYDFDSTLGTWINTANCSNFSSPDDEYRFFYNLEICDIDSDGIGELYVNYMGGLFRILCYTNGELVDFWPTPNLVTYGDVGCSFVLGDITNDGKLDLVFYTPFLATGTGFRIFEFDSVHGFVNTYNISNPGMSNLFGDQMAIGDIDGDMLNELVVSGGPGGIYSEGKLYIFRFDTLIFSADLNANESNSVAIGDYDNDA